MFPLVPAPVFGVAHPIYGLDVAGEGGHSVILRTREQVDRREAFERLSVGLALLSIYFGVGFRERAAGGLGGYFASPSPEEYEEPNYSEEVMTTISELQRARDPYQIQARFTFSRGLALMSDPESAIVEFFKVIELFIKQLAWKAELPPDAVKNVLEDKIIFSKRVKEALIAEGILAVETVGLIYSLKEIRNKFIGHGGMRPALGALFGDPEDYQQLLERPEFKYDPHLLYGADFFERILNDLTLIAGFLFAKMQGLEPQVFLRAGCWNQSSSHVHSVLTAEGVHWLTYEETRFAPC
ncbi:hypothetical protein [Arthrobacter sp. SLBN-112]|uniref:hypothetical protein n=1 Tax=Arthrobacter sp. SLBN-112 TaxID=2768452 RepID=UPI0027AE8D6D|nr:hypothetical protein [Arthrobacter sp. SLBN-112]MDQ0799700.1 hypothetical protein [Arthrobacter sp. SLBN-112]